MTGSITAPDTGGAGRASARVRARILHLKEWSAASLRRASRPQNWREWTLLSAVLLYTVVFSLYVIDKYNAYRTGYFDFGNAVQLVWLASQGHVTAYVYDRPIMALAAVVALIAPVPAVLAVFEAFGLALGAIPVYLIACRILENKDYALGFGLFYLVWPALTGINQYEFHDLSLCVPFVLFFVYFYLVRAKIPFLIAALLALTTTEYAVVMVLFFVGPILWEYFATGRPREILHYVALSIGLAVGWVVYLQSVVFVPTYQLSTVPNGAYTFTGSTAFLNPFLVLSNFGNSLEFDLPAKLLYILLLFGPFLFIALLAPRWLIPALPWFGITILYSPILGQGGVGPAYTVWSQWSSFLVPFVIIASIYGFRRILPKKGVTPRRYQRPRPLFWAMFVAVIICVAGTGAFSPFLGQTTLSLGDELVPVDIPAGAVVHGVWPAPVASTSTLDQFVAMIPGSDSVLTQNQIGSKLGERAEPVWIFYQPGWNNYVPDLGHSIPYPAAILVDTQLVGLCSSCLSTITSSGNYTLYASDPAAGISLYFETP